MIHRFFGICSIILSAVFGLFGMPVSFASVPTTGLLKIDIRDAKTGKPTTVRVRLTQAGKPVNRLPDETVAVSYGLWDHADSYAFQPDSSLYVAGQFRIHLPPGTYQLTLSKGIEYLRQQHTLVVKSNQVLRKKYTLKRWVHMAARGWYSADDHIHIRRSPGENKSLLNWIQAEDINVGVLLKMGDFWETYYPQYMFGEKGNYGQGSCLLTSGQEDPRTPELGHVLGFGVNVGDSTQAAHTTPVYVSIDGGGFHNPETVKHYLELSGKYLRELEQELDTHRDNPEFRAWYYKKALKTRIDEMRQIIRNVPTGFSPCFLVR